MFLVARTYAYIKEIGILCKPYRTLAKQSLIYACGTLLTRGAQLIIAPLTISLVSTQEYGMLALANSSISIGTIILGGGLRQALSLTYFHCTHRHERYTLIEQTVSLYLIWSACISIGAYCLRPYLYTLAGPIPAPMLMLCILIAWCSFFSELYYQLMKYSADAWQLIRVQITSTCITIGSTLLLLYAADWGIYSMLGAQLLSITYITACLIYRYLHTRHYIQLPSLPERHTIWPYMKLGLPYIASMLCSWLLCSVNRYIIALHGTMQMVGIFSIADSACQLINMTIAYSIIGSYMPYMLKQYSKAKNHHTDARSAARVTYVCMIGCSLLLAFLWLTCRSIVYQYAPEKLHESITLLWPLMISSIAYLGVQMLNCYIQFRQKARFLALALCIPTCINGALNYMLIPYLHLHAAVVAHLTAYISYFFITWWYHHKLSRQPY